MLIVRTGLRTNRIETGWPPEWVRALRASGCCAAVTTPRWPGGWSARVVLDAPTRRIVAAFTASRTRRGFHQEQHAMATRIDPRQFVIVASYVSPGVAVGAGGFVIVGGKLKKVPPRGLRQLQAVYQMLEAADGVGDAKIAAQLQQSAIDLAGVAVGQKAAR
ncbi:hypothetical protein [Lysobacter enzymogenes]|uniref:hypothetical protein n=1 Tax=Lysobacter enzymogenes TaxID=69 RepID=UPI0011161E83|nr:hypothetical protein [Lysobacter enzymogenes]UZW59237.1 hypothetical protein BV903_018280 [Lysobacter enzymogenes]